MEADRFDRDRLVAEAMAATGEEDFGGTEWQEGLDILLDSMLGEARLNDRGVEIAAGELANYLATRLAMTAWRRDHPEVAAGAIERPLVIVGQPRTGTTILHDLLAQDPALRAPLTWQVDRPTAAPGEADTYGSDPRIAEVQANIEWPSRSCPGSPPSIPWAPSSLRSACGSPPETSAA